MRRDNFDVLDGAAAVTVLVLDPRIRELHVPVVVRQLVFLRPSSHSLRPSFRRLTSFAALPVLRLQKPLILALQLLFENDTADGFAPLCQALGGLHVRAVEPGVVGQLTGFGDADVERLASAGGAGPSSSVRAHLVHRR